VTLNPSLSDAHFERPAPVERHSAVPGPRSASPDKGADNGADNGADANGAPRAMESK
jgi:hypothetical protein